MVPFAWKSLAAVSPEAGCSSECLCSLCADGLPPAVTVPLRAPRLPPQSAALPAPPRVHLATQKRVCPLSPRENILLLQQQPLKGETKRFRFDFVNSLTLFFGFGSEIRADSGGWHYFYLVHHHLRLIKRPVQLPQLWGCVGLWALHCRHTTNCIEFKTYSGKGKASIMMKKIPWYNTTVHKRSLSSPTALHLTTVHSTLGHKNQANPFLPPSRG